MEVPMNHSLVLRSGLVVLLSGLLLGSCSANPENAPYGAAGSGGGVGGNPGAGGSSAGTGGGLAIDASGDGALDEAGACAGEVRPGALVPLDVYILLDATGSMDGANGTPVVWPSVVSALTSLISDTKSKGIGVGLTYLPVPPPPGFHVPGSCKLDADCPGTTGPCKAITFGLPKTCVNACTMATAAQDCGLYGGCTIMLQNKICNGALVPNVSCDPADYGKPAVEIGVLPDNKDALLAAINAKKPNGDATPTEPSLKGALAHAKQWAEDNPSHLVNVLFATDGIPNNCTTNSIDGAAAAAEAAYKDAPSVPTFVLGIGDLSDLNAIAAKGGTTQAYLADGSSVAQKMLDVLNDIRANGACKFQIPQPKTGTLDYNKVNITYTPLGETTPVEVLYKESEANCDPVKGGWYYDVNPNDGTPTKILLCPATCSEVKLSDGLTVLLGCKTKIF
jgi:hypothetical protein